MNVGRSGHHYLQPYEFPGLIVNSFLLLQIVKMLKQDRRHNGNSTTPGFSFESSPTQSNFIQLRNKQKLGIMVFTVDLLVILMCIGTGIPTVTGKWRAFSFGCLFIPTFTPLTKLPVFIQNTVPVKHFPLSHLKCTTRHFIYIQNIPLCDSHLYQQPM